MGLRLHAASNERVRCIAEAVDGGDPILLELISPGAAAVPWLLQPLHIILGGGGGEREKHRETVSETVRQTDRQ